MSQENVEIVRRIFDAWSSGDLVAARALLHPEIEWHDPPQQPGAAVRHGHAGVEESIRNWVSAWEEWHYELGEFIDAGERVLVIGRQSGRGKESRVAVTDDLFHLWTLSDGKAVEMRMFTHKPEALEAAGLSE